MADKLTELLQSRIDSHEKKTDAHFEKIDHRLHGIDKSLVQINTSLKPHPKPWWITVIVGPLIVGAILAAAGDIIYLHICVKGLQGYVEETGGFIAGLQLQQSAYNPTDPRAVAEVKQVLETAKAKRIKIDPSVVETAGKKFIDASTNNQDAWNAAGALVNYQNQMNPPPLDKSLQDWQPLIKWETHYYLALPPGTRELPRVFAVGGLLPIDNAALMEYFDQPAKAPTESKFGPEFIGLKGASIILDGAHWRNIILKDVTIIYGGEKIDLERVYFIDCTFQMEPHSSNTQRLANAILSPAGAVSFSTI
jgi:hypothetical protein